MDGGTDIRGINEYSGGFEYRSDETDKFVGQYRMGTAVGVDCLYYSLAHQGQKQCDGIDGCQPEVYASWRCDRRVYHLDSDCQYGSAGAGKSGAAHCGFTDSGGVSD